MAQSLKPRRRNALPLAKDISINRSLYLLMVPVIAYYVIFQYVPMVGAVMAFQDYAPITGFFRSPFVGLKHFAEFFDSYYFGRLLGNTISISLLSLAFEFTLPILFALLLNELGGKLFPSLVKNVACFPHFISLVIVCGIVKDFTGMGGIVNEAFKHLFGYDGLSMLQKPGLFRPIYIVSGIWQNMGWDSIIYVAALMAVDQSQYEAARIDGAGRIRQLVSVTLPGIAPTIIVMLLLRIGNIMNVGFEKIILLYNPVIYQSSDVISSFVYRKGLEDFQWSYAAAVGLFNSVINLVLLVGANKASRKATGSSLW